MIKKPGDNETKSACGSLSACVDTNVDALGVQVGNGYRSQGMIIYLRLGDWCFNHRDMSI